MQARGYVMDAQSMEFRLWLGIAVLGLIFAWLEIGHTRRALNRVQQDMSAHQGRSAPSAVAELTGPVTAQ
jgi:hypothetical protein